MASQEDKPPYRVPLMADIMMIPWNGLTVASTFAGAGGSSTGYRMAGYRMVWANEFVPAAQDSYRANMREGTILDGRDIKTVTAAEILKATGLAKGNLDIFDGSPPCQAFSTAGKREKGWGTEKTYEHGASQKNEELFFDYIRLLDGLQPKVFVAENVSGLIKGTAKGFFLEILAALKDCGYKVEARLLDAQWLGVPQARQRIIFIGVRDDLGLAPAFPSPMPYRYSIRDALPLISSASFRNWGKNHERANIDDPSPTIVASGAAQQRPIVESIGEKRKFSISELRRICSFPDDFILSGSYGQQWERLGNSVPPLMMKAVAETLRDKVFAKIVPKAKRPPKGPHSRRAKKVD